MTRKSYDELLDEAADLSERVAVEIGRAMAYVAQLRATTRQLVEERDTDPEEGDDDERSR